MKYSCKSFAFFKERLLHLHQHVWQKTVLEGFQSCCQKRSSIHTLVHDGNEANSDKGKAEMLSSYILLKAGIPLFHFYVCSQDHHYCDMDPSFMDALTCTKEEIYDLLKNLNTSKAAGLDGISARMLKETASAIAPSLTYLFNSSIYQGCFPACYCLQTLCQFPNLPFKSLLQVVIGLCHYCQLL